MHFQLAEFKTTNTTVLSLCLKRTFGSKSAAQLHWPSHKHSTHNAGSFCNRVDSEFVGKNKCINWAFSTNTSHACTAKIALGKLDPWGFPSVYEDSSAWPGTTNSTWVTLDVTDHTSPKPPSVSARLSDTLFDVRLLTRTCISVIVWSLQSLIP